ncbi:MAG: radical SAM protein, partial [Muribaculaceae bacterium]|nr:radical SAM protein [Muribaculaceae bacterium]
SSIFGPIHSRRLGTSLGVNLSPTDGKVCSFDCIYCEAGYNSQGQGKSGLPSRASVKRQLNNKLKEMKENGEPLDVITFSGNGEPTVHPEFGGIISDTLMLRDRYFPEVKVNVLCNSTFLSNPKVVEALKKVDGNILKLDSAKAPTMRLINAPVNKNVLPEGIISDLKQFGGKCIIQTMLLRGSHDGKIVDNTTDEEVGALIKAYKEIKPKSVMLYSIDRPTPESNLQKVSKEELEKIADKIRAEGIEVECF